jgi:hypothetical protein
MGESSRVTEFQGPHAFRVVALAIGHAIELADGKDATGETRWIRAVLTPDRRNTGEIVLEGWKPIASTLGVTVRTAIRYANLTTDRLPVRYGIKGPYVLKSLLRAWVTDRTSTKDERANKVRIRRKS